LGKGDRTMKSVQDVKKMLWVTKAEMDFYGDREDKKELVRYLDIKLGVLMDILDDDLPEEFW